MKRYEALVILHNPAKEEGLRDAIEAVSTEIATHGGRVETVQKMDRKPFSRVASKKNTSGFYTNIIFEAPADRAGEVLHRITGLEQVFRVMLTKSQAVAAPVT